VANGDYIVNLTLGDGSYPRDGIDIWVEDVKQLDNLATPAYQFVHTATAPVSVTDGQLTIRIASTGGAFLRGH